MFAADVSIDPGGILVGLAAVVTALVALRRRKTDNLIRQELSPNGGGSMKDHTAHVASEITALKEGQETIFELLDNVVEQKGREHAEIWTALAEHGIDRRHPPANPRTETP